MDLSAAERETLAHLSDALVPRTDGALAASANDLRVPALAEQAIGTLPPAQQEAFRTLLRAVESPALNLVLTGRPVRFSRLTASDQEAYLLAWADSRIAAKRRGFHSIKRLVCFLYYTALREGVNPAWTAMGYAPREEDSGGGTRLNERALRPLAVDRETTLETEVAVVGSGAGGSVIAAKIAEAGYRVLVVDAGPLLTPETFPRRELAGTDRMLERHGLLTTKDNAFSILQGHVAGGGTAINWMTCLRPPPFVLREWERKFGIPDVTGPEFAANVDEVWARLGVNTDESVLTPPSLVLKRGCEALGMRMGVDFHVTPKNARGCANRCDTCNFGCPYDGKQSTLVTYLPDAQAHGAQFLFDTEVTSVVVKDTRAAGLEAIYRQNGREIPVHVKARAVVLAAGAIETPAIFLRMGIRYWGIGRGLRIHPTTAVAGIYDTPVRMWAGVPQTLHVSRWLRAFRDHGFWLETVPAHPGLAANGFPWRGGRAHKEAMVRYGNTMANIVLVRDSGSGRVTIDRQGHAVVDYVMNAADRRAMVEGIVESARIHVAAGARALTSLHHAGGEIPYRDGPIIPAELDAFIEDVRTSGVTPNGLGLFTAHALGSMPMGPHDPSPVDLRGEYRDVSNLFVGDASVLPSAPGVNPMITIMAMALRTADRVVEGLRTR